MESGRKRRIKGGFIKNRLLHTAAALQLLVRAKLMCSAPAERRSCGVPVQLKRMASRERPTQTMQRDHQRPSLIKTLPKRRKPREYKYRHC